LKHLNIACLIFSFTSLLSTFESDSLLRGFLLPLGFWFLSLNY
jgi:hypothetical protein